MVCSALVWCEMWCTDAQPQCLQALHALRHARGSGRPQGGGCASSTSTVLRSAVRTLLPTASAQAAIVLALSGGRGLWVHARLGHWARAVGGGGPGRERVFAVQNTCISVSVPAQPISAEGEGSTGMRAGRGTCDMRVLSITMVRRVCVASAHEVARGWLTGWLAGCRNSCA